MALFCGADASLLHVHGTGGSLHVHGTGGSLHVTTRRRLAACHCAPVLYIRHHPVAHSAVSKCWHCSKSFGQQREPSEDRP